MKRILIGGVATLCLVATSYGQGSVDFNTLDLGTSAQVYDAPEFGGLLVGFGTGQGTNFFGQLYALAGTGQSSSALLPVGIPVNFSSWTSTTTTSAGYIRISGTTTLGQTVVEQVIIPTPAAGGPVTVQLRGWWGGGTVITNFEGTVTSGNANARWGWSPVLNLNSTGTPPGNPPLLTGLQGFTLVPVPEPASFALAGLGAASLLLFRRRK